MATEEGRGVVPSVCSVCLGAFCQPKFLPCFHTFCLQCVQDLAGAHLQQGSRSFPCPECRRNTVLPPGGARRLQTNFYLPADTRGQQQPPRARDACRSHVGRTVDLYCLTCDQAVCPDCRRSAQHQHHDTEDLASAAARKQHQLQEDRQRLRRAVSDVRSTVTSLQERRRGVERERAEVEAVLLNRYRALLATAAAVKDEQLRALTSLHAHLDRDVSGALQEKESHVAELLDLLQHANDAITSGSASDVISVAKEMASGRGSRPAVELMTSETGRPLQRPVLHFAEGTDVTLQSTRHYLHLYLGVVRKKDMREARPQVTVTERFVCSDDPEVEVFSLCHVDGETPAVIVSFDRCAVKEGAPVKHFTETGDCLRTGSGEEVGRTSQRRYAEGRSIRIENTSNKFGTYCKSPTGGHFSLWNNLAGQADIMRTTFTSTEPPRTTKKEFTIRVGLHRAFDVDDTEQNVVVVEEAPPQCGEGEEAPIQSVPWRSVHLFQRPAERAVCTYRPPMARYQPSDVCFYTLGGEKVLLIVDELSDNIHVVSLGERTLRFERFLCPRGSPVQQPTAIAVDLQGRLWVACRGGVILTLEQNA